MANYKSTHGGVNVLSRRGFIKCATIAAAAASFPKAAFASIDKSASAASSSKSSGIVGKERVLSFNHLHTGEKLKLTYWADGEYLSESLAEINNLLRDFRTGERYKMDPELIDLLHRLQVATGNHRAFEIISGYRSPKTNAMLRSSSSGVAKKSFHMLGQAIDVRLPGTDLKHLHKAAIEAKSGGVGLYTGSNFVHLDTGRVRNWGK